MQINYGACNHSPRSNRAAASQTSDHDLIESIAHGDKHAFQMLYARHHARVYRFILRLVGNEATAEDIVHEVFLDVWRRADEFEAKSRVSTWLLAISRHKAISALRRRSDAQLDEAYAAAIVDLADGPAAAADKSERSAILQKCLAKLSPSHREVINLVYYNERTIEEAARSIGVPINTIKTRMHYARNRIAELLTQAGVDRAWVAI
jgi:RNA polymerase sigma-70 factor (ECF subfamily)